jgi:hypothetical protein
MTLKKFVLLNMIQKLFALTRLVCHDKSSLSHTLAHPLFFFKKIIYKIMQGFKKWFEQNAKGLSHQPEKDRQDAGILLQQTLKNFLSGANKNFLPLQQQHPELYAYIQKNGLGDMTIKQITDLSNNTAELAKIAQKATPSNPTTRKSELPIQNNTNAMPQQVPPLSSQDGQTARAHSAQNVQQQSIPKMPPPPE